MIDLYDLLTPRWRDTLATTWVGRTRDGTKKLVDVVEVDPYVARVLEFREAFLREPNALRSVTHASLMGLSSAAFSSGTLYGVRAHAEGVTLAELLAGAPERKEALDPSIVIRISLDVLGALKALHLSAASARSAIHADVTPGHVLLGVPGTIHLMQSGLGIAAARADAVGPADRNPRLAYKAPEQIRAVMSGGNVDARADVFAVGVMMWEALTGRRLFDAPSDAECVELILGSSPIELPDQGAGRPALRPGLGAAVLRALERDPAKRYANAAELMTELRKVPGSVPNKTIGELVGRLGGATLAKARAELEAASTPSPPPVVATPTPSPAKAAAPRPGAAPPRPGPAVRPIVNAAAKGGVSSGAATPRASHPTLAMIPDDNRSPEAGSTGPEPSPAAGPSPKPPDAYRAPMRTPLQDFAAPPPQVSARAGAPAPTDAAVEPPGAVGTPVDEPAALAPAGSAAPIESPVRVPVAAIATAEKAVAHAPAPPIDAIGAIGEKGVAEAAPTVGALVVVARPEPPAPPAVAPPSAPSATTKPSRVTTPEPGASPLPPAEARGIDVELEAELPRRSRGRTAAIALVALAMAAGGALAITRFATSRGPGAAPTSHPAVQAQTAAPSASPEPTSIPTTTAAALVSPPAESSLPLATAPPVAEPSARPTSPATAARPPPPPRGGAAPPPRPRPAGPRPKANAKGMPTGI